MMKQFTFILTVCIVLLFAACQSSPSSGDYQKGDPEAAKTHTPKANKPAPKPQQPERVNPAEQSKKDRALIEKFVKEKGLKGEFTNEGVFYIEEKAGKGKNTTIEDKVKVHYTGTLLDGSKFDSSVDRGQPATFPLKGVVKGWQVGIPLIKEGGKGKLIIPSGLAYGPMARPKIPANSVLIFDVEVFEVNPK